MSVRLLEVTAGRAAATGDTTCPEQVSLSDEAFRAVKRLPERPLNLVTIWGAGRTGKSFFMNAIAGVENGVFPVSGGSDPCTQGAFISTTTCSLSAFSKMSAGGARPSQHSQSRQEPEIGFVDVEGQGDKHSTYETRLATPLLLLSKVVIFNWHGLMNRSTMLDKLGTMRAAAAQIDRSQRKGAFGHLIVLLRDVPDEKEEQKTQKRLFDLEEDFDGDDVTDEEEEHMKERNQIRRALEASFQSLRVCCLPPPHAEIWGGRQISQGETSKEFRAKVGKLRSLLVTEMLAEPHHFGEQAIVGGSMLSSLLRGVCEAANKGLKNFRPLSLMESVQLAHAETVCNESVQLFSQLTAPRFAGVPPMSKAATESALQEATSTAVERFTDQESLAESLRDRYWQKVVDAIAERSKACYARQERQVADGKLDVGQLLSDANSRVHEKISLILPRLPMPEGELASAWNTICAEAHQSLEASVANGVSAGVLEDVAKQGAGPPTAEAFKRIFAGKFDSVAASNRTQQTQAASSERLAEELREGKKDRAALEKRMEREERSNELKNAKMVAKMESMEAARRRDDERRQEEWRDERDRLRRREEREDRKLEAEARDKMASTLVELGKVALEMAKNDEKEPKGTRSSKGDDDDDNGSCSSEKRDKQPKPKKPESKKAAKAKPTAPEEEGKAEKKPKSKKVANAKPTAPEEEGKAAAAAAAAGAEADKTT